MADVTVTPGTEFDRNVSGSSVLIFPRIKNKAVAGIEQLLQIMERYRKQK